MLLRTAQFKSEATLVSFAFPPFDKAVGPPVDGSGQAVLSIHH